MILIFNWRLIFGTPSQRTAYIYITDGTTPMMYEKNGLDATGDLQALLNGMESALYAEALVSGTVPTPTEVEIAAAISWYAANPGTATAVFGKSPAQEVTDVTAMLLILFPGNTAPIIAARTGMLQLLLSSLWDTRVNARDRGLI